MEKNTLQNHKITQSDDKIEGKKVSSMRVNLFFVFKEDFGHEPKRSARGSQ